MIDLGKGRRDQKRKANLYEGLRESGQWNHM